VIVVRRKRRARALTDVSLDRDLLRVLFAESGLTQTTLGRKVRVSQQTLSAHLRAPGMGRCSPILRNRLAKHFAVSPEELGGASLIDPRFPFVPGGYEYRYSATTHRAALRLSHRVLAAVQRDLTRWSNWAVPDDVVDRPPDVVVINGALGVFIELLLIGRARRQFLAQQTSLDAYTYFVPFPADLNQPMSAPLPGNTTHEAAVVGAVRYWESVLSPWFDGEAHCNYRAIHRLVHPEVPNWGGPPSVPDDHPWTLVLASPLPNNPAL
jgi:hypothetical protein